MWLDRAGTVINSEPALTRVDSEVNFDWTDGSGPFVGAANLGASKYVGARWTGLIAAEYDEEYTFFVDVPPDHQVL